MGRQDEAPEGGSIARGAARPPGGAAVSRGGACVILPSYRSRRNLIALLPDLLRETAGAAAGVIVSDDASDDGTPDAVERAFPDVRVVRRGRNGGFGETCNHGVRAAEGYDVVVLLNTDVRVLPGFLEPLLEHFEKPETFAVSSVAVDPDTGAVLDGPRLGYLRHGRWKWRHLELASLAPEGTVWPTLYPVGAHVAFDRHKFLELGGFDALFSPYYWEDVDLGYRALKRGWRVLVEPRSRVLHRREHSDIERSTSREELARVRHRNMYLFLWKNLHDPGIFWGRHVLPLTLRALYRALRRKGGNEGLADAWHRLPQALRARRRARAQARRGDGEVMDEVREGLAVLLPPARARPETAAQPGSTLPTMRRRSHRSSLTGADVCACLLVHGRRRYFRTAREAARSLLDHSDFDVVVGLGGGDGPRPPSSERLRVERLSGEVPGAGRAGRFLLKFEALEACLRASDAPHLVLLDADAVLVAPTTGRDVRDALGDRPLGMTEQTGIRGSDMDRQAFFEHYRRHSIAFLAPDAPCCSPADFRFFNSGVVLGTRDAMSAVVRWARERMSSASGEHRVGEHMIADQDYFQVWANAVRPGSCAELSWIWNHCEHWDADFPRPGARILHFSNFCRGPRRDTLRRMRAARRGRLLAYGAGAAPAWPHWLGTGPAR